MCQLCCWFTFYCLPRTFSNCLEAFLVVNSLALWPGLLVKQRVCSTLSDCKGNRGLSLLLAAVSVVFRPTALAFFVPLGGLPFHLLCLFTVDCQRCQFCCFYGYFPLAGSHTIQNIGSSVLQQKTDSCIYIGCCDVWGEHINTILTDEQESLSCFNPETQGDSYWLRWCQ